MSASVKQSQPTAPPAVAPVPTGGVSTDDGGIRIRGLTYRVTRPPSSISMRSEPGVDDQPETNDSGLSEGNDYLPPESTADSESNGMAVGEQDEDEEFVMEQNKSEASEDEMEALPPSRTKKGKSAPKVTLKSRIIPFLTYSLKPPHGTFRLQVQGLRQEAPGSGAVVEPLSNKRNLKDLAVDDAPSAKHGKKSEGGLMANWKKLVNYKTTPASTQKSAPAKEAEAEVLVEGEFDREDSSEALAAIRASKPSMVKVKDSQKATPAAIKIVEKSVTNLDTTSRTKHVKYTVSDLPFPGGPQYAAYHARWRKHGRASFMDFAATRPCAYRANSDLTPEVVRTVWNDNFPELNIEAHENSLEIVTSVAGDVLTDWRSSIGMNMLDVLSAFFAEYNLNKDEIMAFVPHALEGFRFIYADPDAPPNEKGGFKSDLILNLFAYHFKKTSNAPRSYGSQAGGLGLCTATMERALFLWRFGVNPIKDEKGNKKKNVTQFNDSDWGLKMRGWIKSASRLLPEDWAYIFEEANIHAGLNGLVDDEDSVEGAADPHATIELWYVSF
ncbi:uncharacterized protein LACBIDRAFT_297049 [Laccaria bicolor S238N-H82]|uniref:Predicted protein n=1 Tax=Laccaria bicolor (strain S238N-H82 / ATCC MYA-4686) TaxID=486041 RepID=B0D9V9_LACBS|nr:uncharacterized protein LACBIDRAFT_297049 [Laccaria bicolor S238N-H82]EDR08654.1 predicted protein [Laccaria bicolor S238N-H82]|eukprot:XP_001880879.1 predicted protein [Laccaria bicolor S238N-H82]